ncbi:(2Fe-2S)-binding protein [Streptomyces sp. NPDC090493]|uniref:(2Fe-2S)-binding protein n=1 Tax=Streptomyces sp. NPDC090493 TaxID=3365964 RepID=UPI0037F57861
MSEQPPEGTTESVVAFGLNGYQQLCTVPTSRMLLDLLRDTFGCQGVRGSCERGVCGACTVLVDGVPVAACATFAFAVDGADVETVEGLAGDDGTLSPQQRAFAERGGYQCGFCTSGMLMTTTALLRHDPSPDRATIREWLSSNTCRCTGYEMIVESVERAARLLADGGAQR